MAKPDKVKSDQGRVEWDLDDDGHVIRVLPAVEQAVEQVPVARLDRALARATRRKTRAGEILAAAQMEYDAAVTYEAGLQALRDAVTE
jgi:hypothetical protein